MSVSYNLYIFTSYLPSLPSSQPSRSHRHLSKYKKKKAQAENTGVWEKPCPHTNSHVGWLKHLCLPHHLSRLKTSRIAVRIPMVKEQGALPNLPDQVLALNLCCTLQCTRFVEDQAVPRRGDTRVSLHQWWGQWEKQRVPGSWQRGRGPFLLNLLLGPEGGKQKKNSFWTT